MAAPRAHTLVAITSATARCTSLLASPTAASVRNLRAGSA